jgi:hypothetical protein
LYDDRATKKGTRLKHATKNVRGLGHKEENLSCMEAKIGQWKQTTKPELQQLKWGS